ncbi:MAG: FAD-dependent oxidoreductase [Candidatus Heimdallarchaeota archaeon]
MQEFTTRLLEVIPRTHCDVCAKAISFRFEDPIELQYKAGQFFVIDIPVNREKYRHHFSFSSSPTEKGYLEFTTKMSDSNFKKALRELNPGDIVNLKGPFGNFTLTEGIKKIAMLAGGIGITPFRSIIKDSIDKNQALNFILLYGNHREEDIIFKEEFDKIQSSFRNLKVVHILLEPPEAWNGYTGFINSKIIQTEIPDLTERHFYVCGPPQMIEDMKKILHELSIPNEQIKTEAFTGYLGST